MMGDGVIDLPAHPRPGRGCGLCRGHCDVEIFSAKNWWKRDPDEVVRTCIERHKAFV